MWDTVTNCMLEGLALDVGGRLCDNILRYREVSPQILTYLLAIIFGILTWVRMLLG